MNVTRSRTAGTGSRVSRPGLPSLPDREDHHGNERQTVALAGSAPPSTQFETDQANPWRRAGCHYCGTISVSSNDLADVRTIDVSGTGGSPRLLHVIADGGNFGRVCTGSFADEPLILSNRGRCPLMIDAITSSSVEFLLPQLQSYLDPDSRRRLPASSGPVSADQLRIQVWPDHRHQRRPRESCEYRGTRRRTCGPDRADRLGVLRGCPGMHVRRARHGDLQRGRLQPAPVERATQVQKSPLETHQRPVPCNAAFRIEPEPFHSLRSH